MNIFFLGGSSDSESESEHIACFDFDFGGDTKNDKIEAVSSSSFSHFPPSSLLSTSPTSFPPSSSPPSPPSFSCSPPTSLIVVPTIYNILLHQFTTSNE